MSAIRHILLVTLAGGLTLSCKAQSEEREPAELAEVQEAVPVNQLTEAEVADGWELLFNGENLDGWRGFRRDDAPAGWRVMDGTLTIEPGVEGGDLMTVREFENFELALEWRLPAGGNSGIMFRVTEDADEPWQTATEMQVLDNAGHPDGQNPETSAGANYALYAPSADVTKPVGEWNAVRILANGPDVTFWMNGVQIVQFSIGSDDWKERVAASKFAEYPTYGASPRGHIDLQDHGNPVWFRNIRIRVLDAGETSP